MAQGPAHHDVALALPARAWLFEAEERAARSCHGKAMSPHGLPPLLLELYVPPITLRCRASSFASRLLKELPTLCVLTLMLA